MADKKSASGGPVQQERVAAHYNARCILTGVITTPINRGALMCLRPATWRDYLKLALRLRFRSMFWLWRNRGIRGMISVPDVDGMTNMIIGVAMGPDTILVGVDPGIEPSCDEEVDDG